MISRFRCVMLYVKSKHFEFPNQNILSSDTDNNYNLITVEVARR